MWIEDCKLVCQVRNFSSNGEGYAVVFYVMNLWKDSTLFNRKFLV